uniref:Uncharacterized protein n=1 Tax=Thermogemmatispora argillosa TaxID=2045280 RepID=A0A455T1H1_9CHLR|nr:hypothetical protein KTA_04840 [Thermogemmatispora argillosa]
MGRSSGAARRRQRRTIGQRLAGSCHRTGKEPTRCQKKDQTGNVHRRKLPMALISKTNRISNCLDRLLIAAETKGHVG